MAFCLVGGGKKRKEKKIQAQKLPNANARAQKASLRVSRQRLICIDFVLLNYSGVFVISAVTTAGSLSARLSTLHRARTRVQTNQSWLPKTWPVTDT